MKKTIFALAILSAFAGVASAQTNVTIYGVADIGIQRIDTNAAGAAGEARWGLDSGMQSGSRLGFKGSEDLGGGLAGIFTLENGFGLDTGALGQGGLLFGRQAWVGLSGGFGAVKLGRQYTPIFNALDSIDPFGTGITGDGSGIIAVFRPYGIRMNNTITYSAPSLGGFNGQIAYGLGEVAGSTSAAAQLGASIGYENGPINAVFAYHDANTATGTGDARTAMLGATYDFRVIKAHAAYADNRDEVGATRTGRSRDAMLGVSVPLGAGTILASFTRHDDRLGAGAADADFWGVGYTHNLSKRTNLYTSYSRVKNDAGSAIGSGAAGVDVNWVNVGVRHKF